MHRPSVMSNCLQGGDWAAEKVITVPAKKVEGWALPDMPGTYNMWVSYRHSIAKQRVIGHLGQTKTCDSAISPRGAFWRCVLA